MIAYMYKHNIPLYFELSGGLYNNHWYKYSYTRTSTSIRNLIPNLRVVLRNKWYKSRFTYIGYTYKCDPFTMEKSMLLREKKYVSLTRVLKDVK